MKKSLTTLFVLGTFLGLGSQTNPVYAQSYKNHLRTSCYQAFNDYRQYSNQPVSSPTSSDFSTSSHNMRMANIALNRVTDCAIQYSKLVQKDSSYCNDAISYTRQISPIMSTAATTISYNCSR